MTKRPKNNPRTPLAGNRKKVLVISPTTLFCFREMIRGICTFAKAKATWQIYYLCPTDNIVGFIEEEKPDGVLFGSVLEELLVKVTSLIPTSVGFCNPGIKSIKKKSSFVLLDDIRVGELAAEYFIEKQYKNFAFIGHSDQDWSKDRQAGFEKRLARSKLKASILLPAWEALEVGRGWKTPYPNQELVPFINTLPKPVAILSCNDIRGREIVEACRNEDIRVPEDVAVLGVDNDFFDCDLCTPPMSSMAVPWFKMGYLAAEKLDALLVSKPNPECIFLPPTGVVVRQSTDIIAISDPDISTALRFIKDHAHVAFGVDDILKILTISRRTLEKKFREQLGRSLHDEIQATHFNRANYLLLHTDIPIKRVAMESGFTSEVWFSKAFRNQYNLSPSDYRNKFMK